VPNFTYKVKKVTVRQLDAKADNFARHHFTDGVETATPFREICDLGRVMTGGSL
jgi:hypothetical protein